MSAFVAIVVLAVQAQAGTGAPAALEEPASTRAAPARERCTYRLFTIVKKQAGDGTVGPSQFDPGSAASGPGASGDVECTVARSRNTNVLLLLMVKSGFERPEAVVGAEWGPKSTWERVVDDGGRATSQRRVVKVYLVESEDRADRAERSPVSPAPLDAGISEEPDAGPPLAPSPLGERAGVRGFMPADEPLRDAPLVDAGVPTAADDAGAPIAAALTPHPSGLTHPGPLPTGRGDDVTDGGAEPMDAGAGTPAVDLLVAEPPAPAPPSWQKVVEATGYVDSRTSWTRARTWGLLPTNDVPQVQELVELNTQVKVHLRPRTFVYSDVSLVGSYGGHYRAQVKGDDGITRDSLLDDHQTAAIQPVVSINELYALHEVAPWLNVLVGKKRLTWGSGMVSNPTDLLNPPRDPTDPTFQRSGAWLAQLEVPVDVLTFSFVFAPAVLKQSSGIPTQMLAYPTWDEKDTQLHYLLAARAYALVGDADVNVMAFYGNRFGDDFEKKLRVGLSFSRYFFTDYELHFETLVQTGSARDYLVPGCVESPLAALACSSKKTPVVVKRNLESNEFLPKVLVGTRRQFSDDSMVSLEYLYQPDGWTADDYQSYANGLDLLVQGRAAGMPVNAIPGASALLGGATTSDGLPSRVAFDPRAQHYLFATFQKPRIFDDFTAQLVVIANLQDLSTLWTPSVAWSATEWLTLTLYGFIPAPGLDSRSARTPGDVWVSEYGNTPFAARVLFEARAWF